MAGDIRTRPVTREYEQGYEQAGLGTATRKPGKTTYVVRDGQLVEVSDYRPEPRAPVVGDSHYDGLRTSDGVDVSTRAKHRAYMKEHGLALAGDFKETWAQAEQERSGPSRDPERRDQIGRVIYELENGRRKPTRALASLLE